MKSINHSFEGLISLNSDDMSIINGGDSIWETLGYILGATAKTLYMVGKTAGEYQASLPANLKK
jgi:hypothetical protein